MSGTKKQTMEMIKKLPEKVTKPALFMTVRREIAESRSETGVWSHEGGRRTPCGTLTD